MKNRAILLAKYIIAYLLWTSLDHDPFSCLDSLSAATYMKIESTLPTIQSIVDCYLLNRPVGAQKGASKISCM